MLVLKGFSKWPKFVKRMKITLAIAVTHFSMKFGAVTADPPSVCTRGEAFMSAFTSVSATFMASSLFEADQFFCNHSIKFSMLVEKNVLNKDHVQNIKNLSSQNVSLWQLHDVTFTLRSYKDLLMMIAEDLRCCEETKMWKYLENSYLQIFDML